MLPPSSLEIARQTLLILVPELLILLVATVMMTAGAFVRFPRRLWCGIATGTMLAALLILFGLRHQTIDVYSAIALNDAFSYNARLVLILAGFIVLALAHDQVDDARAPEFFGAFLMINAGSMLVAASNELIFLFVGLELVSMPTYLLLYLSRRNAGTQEAATKYFFLSLFSSALLLYGLAFLYGLTGVSNLKALAYITQHMSAVVNPNLMLIALVFIMAGLGFRVAAVPFHFYAPDVYQGSPTVITALLAWVPKAIGFLAMARVLTSVVSAGGPGFITIDRAVALGWIMAVATMTLGNTVALLQDNLKRLLAYSSIAHAGYLLVGTTVAFTYTAGSTPAFFGLQGVLIYLVAYALMTLGAFGVIIALSTPERPIENVNDLSGLAQTHPVIALAMAVCLFSLAGIPPLAGFYGKFAIFMSVLDAASGSTSSMLWWLAVIGMLNAAVGAYYYLRIVVLMYLRPAPSTPINHRIAWPTLVAVGACAVLSLLLGLLPAPLVRATREATVAAGELPEPGTAPIALVK
ncbi:NADH dehydrogenase subunit N [Singulisphaera sp. GP187]|uniref:NADH-quinone oxidoreductase subunit N n=1 Tax=Singulisphaera sp. GP187 TaxID=1882752 RepID=UPI000927CB50|nr:NADH-quinone oxidoreductase subunit N [Singulisphaera sp. GP187]SIO62129.1 NADH dehydrogenase subunit N [Singulisphaera sp. GP187]